MIFKAVKRGDGGRRAARSGLRNLMAYLFKVGDGAPTHTNPHVVDAWNPHFAVLGAFSGCEDLDDLAAALHGDLDARWRGQSDPVYHAVFAAHPDDGDLGDTTWSQIAREFLRAQRLDVGDGTGVPWVAVNHGRNGAGADHLHIVATLLHRPDATGARRVANLRRDYLTGAGVAQWAEQRYGLVATAQSGATSRTRADAEIAARSGRRLTDREELREIALRAAARAAGWDGYLRALRQAGVHVRVKTHPDTGEVQGYTLALPKPDGSTGREWSASRLGPTASRARSELTHSRLQQRWDRLADWVRTGTGILDGDQPLLTPHDLRGTGWDTDFLAAFTRHVTTIGTAPADPSALAWLADACWSRATDAEPAGEGPWTDLARMLSTAGHIPQPHTPNTAPIPAAIGRALARAAGPTTPGRVMPHLRSIARITDPRTEEEEMIRITIRNLCRLLLDQEIARQEAAKADRARTHGHIGPQPTGRERAAQAAAWRSLQAWEAWRAKAAGTTTSPPARRDPHPQPSASGR